MVYSRIPEQEAFYQGEQNIIERIMAGISSTDDFIRLTNIILKRQNDLLEVIAGQSPGGGDVNVTFPKLAIHSVSLLTNVVLRDTTTIAKPGTELADCRGANRVVVRVTNLLDQVVRVTITGNLSSSVEGTDILYQFNCPVSESRSYGLKLEEWRPYIGLEAQALVTPTAGNLNAIAIIQE